MINDYLSFNVDNGNIYIGHSDKIFFLNYDISIFYDLFFL